LRGEELRQRRGELVHAERGADVDAQQALGLRAELRHLVLGLVDVGEDALAAVEIRLASGVSASLRVVRLRSRTRAGPRGASPAWRSPRA
jgi:hypothetical protein